MNQVLPITRRLFLKAAGAAGAAAALTMSGISLVKEAEAAAIDFVGKRQASVYQTDANAAVYKIRKSQDNPMVKKLYAKDGFLSDGPCGHRSHVLLHTRYFDRSASVKELKAKGIKLKV